MRLIVPSTWLIGGLLSASVAAQPVFKCPDDSGALVFQQEPCDGGETVDLQPIPEIGSGKGSGVHLSGTNCAPSASGSYAIASGFVVNTHASPVEVRLSSTFTYRGVVVDTTERAVTLRPFERQPFSHMGGPGRIDQCQWQWVLVRGVGDDV